MNNNEPKDVEEVEECEHDLDDGICMTCGEDLREELSAQAYDRAKDYAKYGE